MPEFLSLLQPPEALKIFLNAISWHVKMEEIETSQAFGRVNAKVVHAPHPLPTFPRSTVDGYAVRAADTYGASEALPTYLNLMGEIAMGTAPEFFLQAGACALIHTGGMLPEGTDAVVMLEYTQEIERGEIEVLRPVAVGENVIKIGEDVSTGEEVIPPGRVLRPAEIGGLMALGTTRLWVASRPRVGIVSSGDEVIDPDGVTNPGKVRDVNSYSLSALVDQSGGVAVRYGIAPDQEEVLENIARKALSECDMLVITAGSSASSRDLTAKVINKLGRPGVLVHGVNIRPGKPTILAACDGKAVVGLPGNPVSALVIAGLFLTPAIEQLLGLDNRRRSTGVLARLSQNLPSQAGREDWVPVRLSSQEDQLFAEPVFGKSNLIFTLVRADGLVRIPPDTTGLAAGEWVRVIWI